MTATRILSLPREGYGPEPRTSADIMMLIGARVQLLLPSRWTVAFTTSVGAPDSGSDATLTVARDGETVVSFDAEIKRSITRGAVLSMTARLEAMRASDGRVLVVSRYITPRVREELRQQGISYADATGNLLLTTVDPLMLVSDRGATSDPWSGPGRPTTSLKGLPATLLARALIDYAPPYTVSELARLAKTSLGASYRLVDYLVAEGIVSRAERGPITAVDWPELLRRWSADARYLDTNTTRGFLEPRGLDSLTTNLAQAAPAQRYAVSGSLAAQPYAPFAEPRLALLYADDPVELAATLGLREVETGANVLMASPRSPTVFERTTTWQGVTLVSPSQAVADLLSGPGRNPAEGDHLLEWMENNVDTWRLSSDR
ncbi:hypothetical protein [Aeromicrobium stalagmiti]|uniref:hypothetical protein n=1 Tax=Aeromicrobium stalagmiti TaxID=2738988 RepID=UPI00156A2425|nr:hypothetical protein [Aeromicrobium stalagmiti]NRQ51070.1 hypothetical protein [Aeromicrobium stalagmiti]